MGVSVCPIIIFPVFQIRLCFEARHLILSFLTLPLARRLLRQSVLVSSSRISECVCASRPAILSCQSSPYKGLQTGFPRPAIPLCRCCSCPIRIMLASSWGHRSSPIIDSHATLIRRYVREAFDIYQSKLIQRKFFPSRPSSHVFCTSI